MIWNEIQKKRYRGWLIFLIGLTVFLIVVFSYFMFRSRIPDEIILFQGEENKQNISLPAECKMDKSIDTMKMQNSVSAFRGKLQANVRLFGIIPLKKMRFTIVKKQKVMPSGRAIGLYLETDGMMVLGTCKVNGKDGLQYEPSKDILKEGDYIKKINGKRVVNIQMVADVVNECRGKAVVITLLRGKQEISVKVQPISDEEGFFRIGAWLREDTEGIGTLSFVSKENQYAALGHGITDADTGLLVHLNHGSVYPAKIGRIVKGKAGAPGEVLGTVNLQKKVGDITRNSELGILGKLSNSSYGYQEKRALPVGLKQQIQIGRAWIYCQLGKKVTKYQIAIEKVNLNSKDNKGMEIKIMDPLLLRKTGGIIQGMSGSPIVQNGRVIGAVTHVFVDDPTKGYGTFIENMLY